jgi:prepilin-type N-terminal cleavage/methylation domain-containing protein/prepilin-type processing-associated H-X9-DG protein
MNTINSSASSRKQSGFTLIEMLVVIATIAVLACLLLPALAQTSRKASRTQCLNNLKLINLSFHIWEGDYSGRYPTAVSTASGGAMENICTQNTNPGGAVAGYNVANVFRVMSNKLSAPRILTCPADRSKTFLVGSISPAAIPGTLPTGLSPQQALDWASFGSTNLSYFVEGNASDKYPNMILIGDRSIGTSSSAGAPAAAMNMGGSAYANARPIGVSFPGGQKNTPPLPWQWTDADIHQGSGNLGMADGSCQQTTLGGLYSAIMDTRDARANNAYVILNMP